MVLFGGRCAGLTGCASEASSGFRLSLCHFLAQFFVRLLWFGRATWTGRRRSSSSAAWQRQSRDEWERSFERVDESSLYDNHRLHDSDRRARGESGLDVMQRAEYVTPPLRCPTDNRESGMPSRGGRHIESQKTSIPISCNRCQEPSLATTLASQHTAGSSLRPH